MSTDNEIALEDLHAGNLVPANLIERIDVNYARGADDLWATFLAAEVARAQTSGVPITPPEHSHWCWERKVAATSHLLSYPTLAIECDGKPQGLMLLKTDGEFGRLPEHAFQPLVYVVFLAAAPWNLPTIVARPRFRGIGTMLMRIAIDTSLDLGFKGRLGLHSLPQANSFYERHGMICLGSDRLKQDLEYFEMTAAQAASFIR